MDGSTLKPAAELARASQVRFPNESAEYRRAREALLAEEIELRRHIERVAELRRALPPGGEVKKKYEFEGEGGKAALADLFGDKQTLDRLQLHVRAAARTAVSDVHVALGSWEDKLPDIQQRTALAIVARSPIARLIEARSAAGSICRSTGI